MYQCIYLIIASLAVSCSCRSWVTSSWRPWWWRRLSQGSWQSCSCMASQRSCWVWQTLSLMLSLDLNSLQMLFSATCALLHSHGVMWSIGALGMYNLSLWRQSDNWAMVTRESRPGQGRVGPGPGTSLWGQRELSYTGAIFNICQCSLSIAGLQKSFLWPSNDAELFTAHINHARLGEAAAVTIIINLKNIFHVLQNVSGGTNQICVFMQWAYLRAGERFAKTRQYFAWQIPRSEQSSRYRSLGQYNACS